jgi:fructuronate reductase
VTGAPGRIAHLGLGAFFRAHQAWYTQWAPDGDDWPITAFTGRRPDLAEALRAQDHRYTLVTRGPDGDRMEVVDRVVEAVAGTDHAIWLHRLSSPALAVVTTTVTEAGYHLDADGHLDRGGVVGADHAALRADPRAPVRTVPARLVAGLAARRAADAGPVAIVPCDNLRGNGAALGGAVREAAADIDAGLAAWIDGSVSFVSTMVDRITPATRPEDLDLVRAATGREDRCPVVTEPFSEWVLSGAFPSGRPAWDAAGATIAADVTPFEDRKLWLLNGAHSLLAYAGAARGHRLVSEAIADPVCARWVRDWWGDAVPYLRAPAGDAEGYQEQLLARWANGRIAHHLDQIARDGSQKLRARVVPILERERAAGRMPPGAVRVLGAWLGHLRGAGGTVHDPVAELAERVLGAGAAGAAVALEALSPELAADAELVTAVAGAAGEVVGTGR